jgi:hypothetical protein
MIRLNTNHFYHVHRLHITFNFWDENAIVTIVALAVEFATMVTTAWNIEVGKLKQFPETSGFFVSVPYQSLRSFHASIPSKHQLGPAPVTVTVSPTVTPLQGEAIQWALWFNDQNIVVSDNFSLFNLTSNLMA